MPKDPKSETKDALHMRGARSLMQGRFESVAREAFDDGWTPEEKDERPLQTQVTIERARSIVSHNDSPDVGFDSSINPYRGCEHGCIYCLSGDTLILMADGTARPLANLLVGDEIYGTKLDGGERRLVKSRVLAHWSVVKPAYRVLLRDGTELISSGNHRFLTETGWRFVGDAEQCFGPRRRLRIGDRLAGVAAEQQYAVANGSSYPGAFSESVGVSDNLAVSRIESLGKAMQLYDITTETEDFIANGVVSHNCYARPSHSYLELSPGLDFETKLYAKTNAAELLRAELAKPGYKPTCIALGANTDCYQPIERKYKITRQILEVLAECNHPVSLVTKSALVERDLDILGPMAEKNLVRVFVSIGTLDRELARKLEPRAASPQRRLDILKALKSHGVPCGVMVAALIPALNDKTMEHVLEAAAAAGAEEAAYVIMRLPNELKDLFKEWLAEHYPDRAEHVISIVRQMRGGKENDPNFGTRMSGVGNFADLIAKRFDIACRKYSLNEHGAGRRRAELDCTLFRPPAKNPGQFSLF
jgi:DNA repair photolyase